MLDVNRLEQDLFLKQNTFLEYKRNWLVAREELARFELEKANKEYYVALKELNMLKEDVVDPPKFPKKLKTVKKSR